MTFQFDSNHAMLIGMANKLMSDVYHEVELLRDKLTHRGLFGADTTEQELGVLIQRLESGLKALQMEQV